MDHRISTSDPADTPPIQLDVWSDVACPWCYIGMRRLDQAIAEREPGSVAVRYRAFELRPDLPVDGLPRRAFYERMFGSEDALRGALARVQAEGGTVGITFAWDAMPKAPNTRLAHRALQVVYERFGADAQATAKQELFAAFFERAEDVTDPAVVERATGVVLDGDEGRAAVEADELLAAQLRIRGVPFFIASKRVALSGAMPAEYFTKLLDQASQDPAAAA